MGRDYRYVSIFEAAVVGDFCLVWDDQNVINVQKDAGL